MSQDKPQKDEKAAKQREGDLSKDPRVLQAGSTTRHITSTDLPDFDTLQIPVSLKPGEVMLRISGRNTPLIMEQRREMIIGRRSAEDDQTVQVDLTQDGGAALGVSRHHLRLVFEEDGVFAEDLGSTNGSYLDEVPMSPHMRYVINNNAQLRLGKVIIMVQFASTTKFSTEQVRLASSEQKLELVGLGAMAPKQPRAGFSPEFLMTELGAFLETLVGFQESLNRIVERNQTIGIKNIKISTSTTHLYVTLIGADDIVPFISDQFAAWIAREDQVVTRLRAQYSSINRASSNGVTAQLLEELPSAAHEAVSELLSDYIRTTYPDIPMAKRVEAVDTLLPYLVTIICRQVMVVG